MRRELALGLDSLTSAALDGAARFAAGEGWRQRGSCR